MSKLSNSDFCLRRTTGYWSSVGSSECFRGYWAVVLPLCVLFLGLLTTFEVSRSIQTKREKLEAFEFEHSVQDLTTLYSTILRQYESLLVTVRGLYISSDNVSRVEFDDFISSIDLTHNFPAAKGVAWHPHVLAGDVSRFEAMVAADDSLNNEGYPDFHIKPESENFEHFPVAYAAPKGNLNKLLGYDLVPSEPRYTAVLKSRDSGKSWGTAPIELMDMKGQANSTGFLIVLAVFNKSNSNTTGDERGHFKGVLSATFQASTLLDNERTEHLNALRVYDVTDAERSLLFSSGQEQAEHRSMTSRITIAGRIWEFKFSKGMAHIPVWFRFSVNSIAAFSGLFISLLLSLLTYVLMMSRNRAMALATSLTQDLQRVNDDLTRSNHDLGQFAYVASHDLQTPVRNVQSTIILLEDALDRLDRPSANRYLNHLRKSASHMQNFIGDLLMYAQAEKSELILEPIDLNKVLREVLETLKFKIDETEAVVEVASLPQIRGDSVQLQRLFTNLLNNAIKYRDLIRRPLVVVSVESVDGHWAIRVEDNGIGIEPEHQARVLEPFQRLHRHDDIAGSGLGLNICSEIMVKHEGHFQLESEFGKGTVCILLFKPLAVLQQAA